MPIYDHGSLYKAQLWVGIWWKEENATAMTKGERIQDSHKAQFTIGNLIKPSGGLDHVAVLQYFFCVLWTMYQLRPALILLICLGYRQITDIFSGLFQGLFMRQLSFLELCRSARNWRDY